MDKVEVFDMVERVDKLDGGNGEKVCNMVGKVDKLKVVGMVDKVGF